MKRFSYAGEQEISLTCPVCGERRPDHLFDKTCQGCGVEVCEQCRLDEVKEFKLCPECAAGHAEAIAAEAGRDVGCAGRCDDIPVPTSVELYEVCGIVWLGILAFFVLIVILAAYFFKGFSAVLG